MKDEKTSEGRDMIARVAAHDWSSSGLGPPESWPVALRTAAGICLHSRFPLWVGWGRDLIMIYNDGFKEVLQVKHPWALGRPTREVWSEVWDVIGPMLESVLAGGEATWSDDQLLILERSGRPEETYFTWSYSPIQGDDGRVGGVFTTVKETTERVLAERRLHTLQTLSATRSDTASSQRDVARLCAMRLGENPHDLPFTLLYLPNEAGDLELAASTGVLADHPEVAGTIAKDDPRPPWRLDELRAGGGPLVVDVPNGPSFHLEDHALPVSSAVVTVLEGTTRDRPAGLLVAGVSPFRPFDTDYRAFLALAASHVTTALANARALEEERQRAEALRALDKAKTEFFSNISHEFRTPLTLMLGPIEETLADPATIPTNKERARAVHRNALRLLRLVNSLLDLSRLEAGKLRGTFRRTDLGPFTAEIAETFRSAAEEAGITLAIETPTTPLPAYVDREMWEKIVLNLVSNAYKHTFQGTIRVRMNSSATHAILSVIDTGVGIPAAELPRLFERFHRVASSRSRTHEGSGIGLSLVHELAGLHGGEVRVESEEGRGSGFHVLIPLGKDHLPEGSYADEPSERPTLRHSTAFSAEVSRWGEPDDEVATAAPAGAPRVLLVEDNADMRDHLRRILGKEFRVSLAHDGADALEHLARELPDLVLSDVMMPRMDGFELLRRMRGDERLRYLPVILLSARAGEESRIEGIERGADDYVVKPFTARELLARVRSNVELSRARRTLLETEQNARLASERLHAQADQAIANFSYVLGHDLKEPIRAVATLLHVLDQDHGAKLDAPARNLVAEAVRSNERLGRIVGGLLRFSLAASGQLEPWLETDLRSIAPPAARVEGASLRFAAPTETLRRILQELADNAHRHHSRGAPTIVLRAARRPGGMSLVVEDDGPGFSPTFLDEFHRHGLGTRHGGFGLAIVKSALERHGAHVLLSNRPQGGARVEIFLPGAPPFALARSEDRAPAALARIAEDAPVMLWTTDETGACTYLNPQWCEFVGRPLETQLGHGWLEPVHPEDSARARDVFLGALRDRTAFRILYRLRRHDGVYRWCVDAGAPRLAADGKLLGYVGSVVDVTDQKEAEQGLSDLSARLEEQVEARTRSLLDARRDLAGIASNIPGAFFRSDAQAPWRIHVMTEEVYAITGRMPEEFVEKGLLWADIMVPEDVPLIDSDLQRAYAERLPYDITYRIYHTDGSIRWVNDRGRAIYDEGGTPRFVEGVVLDITAAKANETQLAETTADLQTFTNSVSHDLRGPLRGIDLYLGELDRALPPDAEARRLVAAAMRENEKAARLVHHLLAFSRGGHKPLQYAEVDLTAIAHEIAEEIDARHDWGTRWELPEEPFLVPGDAGLLRIALQTILHNAAKYSSMKDAPRVELSCSADGDERIVRIHDNGVGFPPDEADRLFEPFRRLSTAAGFEGTGLGLVTAKRIVARHGGTIAGTSAPGAGTTFIITLPGAAPGKRSGQGSTLAQ